MSNEVVKYHNDLNKISLSGWTSEEMDFFFSIIWAIKDKGNKEVTLSREELVSLANYSNRHNQSMVTTIKRLADHMHSLYWIEQRETEDSYSIKTFSLFKEMKFQFSKDFTKLSAIIRVSDAFQYLVNDLSGNFTSWELKQFTQLRSTYAKTAYRLLKQYRSTGYRKFDIEEFKHLFGIPKSYRATDINKRVFGPILNELKPYFLDLEIEPDKKRTHGNPITAYRFRWQPELIEDWEPQKFDKKALATSQRAKRSKKANDPTWYDDKQTSQASDELVQQALELQKSRKEQQ